MTQREIFFRHLGLPSFNPIGLEIEKAEGIYLYDTNGKEYIDLVSGISVSNTGHRHPHVILAIKEQLDKYLYLNVYGEFIQSAQVMLAEKLVSFLPEGLSSVYLVNSGSEAVEGALKLAKRFTGRTEIIAFQNAYHGSTQGALSILGNEYLKNAFRPLLPDIKFLEFNKLNDLQRISARTACVVAETIQAEAGIILPEQGYLEELRKRCTDMGALLVIDDVQMGFGRTGCMFSFEHYNFIPDILILAKAMGAGMPIGAFISSKQVMDTLAFAPELGHITTFGGHPVSCAASLAGIEVLTSGNLINEAALKGKVLHDNIVIHRSVAEIRMKGLAMGVQIKHPEKRILLTERMLDNGIIIDWFLFKPNTFRIAPPLTITMDEIELCCTLILKSLDEI
ncbi:MAG: aspartate aminotransferase family protein [Bacteroidetes bacterium]|nr:aspartate aminotransferase family protein [Bacteroidota bacterium]